jgi:hypothetical protein
MVLINLIVITRFLVNIFSIAFVWEGREVLKFAGAMGWVLATIYYIQLAGGF